MVRKAVAQKFFETLEEHGVYADEIEMIGDDARAMSNLSLYLKEILPEAEANADLKRRHDYLKNEIKELDLNEEITTKLLSAGYDVVWKVAMTTRVKLCASGFTLDEIEQIDRVLYFLGFGGLKRESTSNMTRLLDLWDDWKYMPAAARKLYGI